MSPSTTPSVPPFWSTISPSLRNSLSSPQIEHISHQPPNDPDVLCTEHELALDLSNQGKRLAALELFQHVLTTRQHVLGTAHPDTLTTMHYVGLNQYELGQYSDAEGTYRTLVALYENAKLSLGARSTLGLVLVKEGKYTEAEGLLRELLNEMEGKFGEGDPKSLGCLRHLMEAVGGQGRIHEALEMNERGMETVGEMGGDQKVKRDELAAMMKIKVEFEESKSKAQEV